MRPVKKVGFIALIVMIWVAISCGKADSTSQGGKAVTSTSAHTVAPEPKPALATSLDPASKRGNPEPRPQGPEYRAGKIETMKLLYFFGRVGNDGIIKDTQSSDGKPLPPHVAEANQGTKVNIEHQGHDPCLKRKSILPLYKVTGSNGEDLCKVDNPQDDITDEENTNACNGERDLLYWKAIAIRGWWDESKGTYHENLSSGGAKRDVFTLACISGIAAKCAHWGYIPWLSYDEAKEEWGASGTPLKDYYTTCVHAARADYAASGDFMTCGDTTIDIFDKLHIRKCYDGFNASLESTWGSNGKPTCVRKGRYKTCEKKLKDRNVKVDTACDLDFAKCPNPKDEKWPSGVLLRVRAPEYNPPNGVCPTEKSHCKK